MYPRYTLNGRYSTWDEVVMFWRAYGRHSCVVMEKLDRLTPWHVL
jgi:hypothetical protein